MNAINQAEKLLDDLIEEAKINYAYIKDENKRKNYREMKEKQFALLSQLIESAKNPVILENSEGKIIFETPKRKDGPRSIREIEMMSGKEEARRESIKRAQEFMNYQERTYGKMQ